MINIIKKEECTGCYACKNICPQNCINMNIDKEGFWYPDIDVNKCNDCGLCEKVCPILNISNIHNNPSFYACINKNKKIRKKSSSGGLFNLIAEEIIDNNGVVFGAKFNSKFEVEHSFINTKEELYKFRGSKYVQSKIGYTFQLTRRFLKENKQVLYSGTPCQISGLISYLGRKYDNLITLDIVCHGVPSPKVWKKYIDYRETISGALTQRINFRCKNEGWKQYCISFLFENDTEYSSLFSRDPYMQIFLQDICLRPSCYNCKFKTLNRQSDITLADFWGIQNVLPEMDDNKGTSLVMINTRIGEDIFRKIHSKMLYKQVDVEAIKINQAAIKSANYNPKRDIFFEDLEIINFNRLIKQYCSDKFLIRVKRLLKTYFYNFKKHYT